MTDPENKTVSIIIPCLNEEKNIAGCLNTLLENDYPKELLEILVVDGMSEDNTRVIVKEFCNKYPNIRLIDNPDKIKPIAMNLGIQAGQSEILMRIDAHAEYPRNYISTLVSALIDDSIYNVGALTVAKHRNSSIIQQAMALAYNHKFYAGSAGWRTGEGQAQEVDTVSFGCFPRKVFSEIGMFNERLIRAQDKEFNYRIRKSGGKIILLPELKVHYLPRDSFIKHIVWSYNGAFWQFYASRFTDVRLESWRNFIPMLFLGYLVTMSVLAISDLTITFKLFSLIPLFIYTCLLIYFSSKLTLHATRVALFPCLIMIFFEKHISYGAGSIIGLIASKCMPKRTN